MNAEEAFKWKSLSMCEGFRGALFPMIDDTIKGIENEILETCTPDELLPLRARRTALLGVKSDAEERIRRALTQT